MSNDNSPSSKVTYPRSPEDFGSGPIIAGVLAAFLVIGIVVYSIVNMNEVQHATVNSLPAKSQPE